MTKNVAASVRQRLLNRSRQRKENFNNLLTRYGIERLLYRLSKSDYAGEFVLKGSNLFYARLGQIHRPTKDVDMLRVGPTDPDLLVEIIRTCATSEVEDDGVVFDASTIAAQVIREVELYSGVRVTLKAYLGKAVIALQLDVGIGDSTTPGVEPIEYPSLLDGSPCATLNAYRFETVIAEKCEAMVKLGLANTRMKDFFDVFILARDMDFDGVTLTGAVRDTFSRRRTSLPSQTPVAWTPEFSQDAKKVQQWGAFLKKSKLEAPPLHEVVEVVSSFLMPVCDAARDGHVLERWIDRGWPYGGDA